MHTAGRIRQADVRIALVVTPSRNVRTSWILFGRYTATGIITRRKRNIHVRLLSSEKELIHYFVKNYSLWKLKDIIMQ